MIHQYLENSSYHETSSVLEEETRVLESRLIETRVKMRKIEKRIREGLWKKVQDLLRGIPELQYAAYKQEYLELIMNREHQRAFSFLNTNLKQLEHVNPEEFSELCYLLTCRAVGESKLFSWWEKGEGRRVLLKKIESYHQIKESVQYSRFSIHPNKLINMLQQAVAYQLSQSKFKPQNPPQITTLLRDYSAFALPDSPGPTSIGHTANVKCVCFNNNFIVSGSSDMTVRLWNISDGSQIHSFTGHRARIWDLTNLNGHVASCSSDGTIRIWDVKTTKECRKVINAHESDIYSIDSTTQNIASASYDHTVKLFDTETGEEISILRGHSLAVTGVIFSPSSNFVVSGGKDTMIMFWDLLSGVCVQEFGRLGEITSVEMSMDGRYLLTASKDNANRLWDIRMGKPIVIYRGHQNTSKNLIRCRFGPEGVVIGGSEDGFVYLWDLMNGKILQKLGRRFSGAVFDVKYSKELSIIASSTDDMTIRSWVVRN